ncbi:MAG: hypothetical protein ACREVE_14310 [Gammaproteobacteria bacterium]
MSSNKLFTALAVVGICAGLMGAGGDAEAARARTVTLKWAAGAQQVIGYEVYYGKTAVPARMRLLASPTNLNLAAPAVQFNVLRDLGALPGQGVCFRVKAYGTQAKSAFSDAVCTTI